MARQARPTTWSFSARCHAHRRGFTVTNNLTGGAAGNLAITTQNSSQSAIVASSLQDKTAGTLTPLPSAAYYTVGVFRAPEAERQAPDLADGATGQTAAAPARPFTRGHEQRGRHGDHQLLDLAAANRWPTTDLSQLVRCPVGALTQLNAAITDVAAQDGYIGAQINTLSAVSNVLSTQSENVQSAQNAVQATDYASASSNMSKYEILSQTGISALAQANSMQQEVTKLLQ